MVIIVKYSQELTVIVTVMKDCFKNPHRNFPVHSTRDEQVGWQ